MRQHARDRIAPPDEDRARHVLGDELLGGLQDISMCANMGEKIAYCSNQCVDTSQDERHCGGCGRDCAMGETCEGGMCKAP